MGLQTCTVNGHYSIAVGKGTAAKEQIIEVDDCRRIVFHDTIDAVRNAVTAMIDIDTGLVEAMALATQPPAIVRPYFQPDEELKTLASRVLAEHRLTKQNHHQWIDVGDLTRRQLSELFENNRESITERHIQTLRYNAEVLEKTAENYAVQTAQSKKSANRLSKQFTASLGSGEHQDTVVKCLREVVLMMELEVEEYLNMAMFMKALAGQYDLDKIITFTANTAGDVDAYFTSLGIK